MQVHILRCMNCYMTCTFSLPIQYTVQVIQPALRCAGIRNILCTLSVSIIILTRMQCMSHADLLFSDHDVYVTRIAPTCAIYLQLQVRTSVHA